MKRFLAGALMLLVAAAAFFAGRISSTSQFTSSPSTGVKENLSTTRWVFREDVTCEAELAATKKKLAFANEFISAQFRARTGVPVEFPPNLPFQYTEEGFEVSLSEIMSGCEASELQVFRVDCAEFPCMVFFTQPLGSYNHAIDNLMSCSKWRRVFDPGGQANSSFMTDDGMMEYSVAAPKPLGTMDDNSSVRWDYRLEQGRSALMDEYGGRDATDLEEIDQSIRFWKERREEAPENASQYDKMLIDIEMRRARLVSEGVENGE